MEVEDFGLRSKSKGVFCSKSRLILLIIVWILITVAIGVLAGLFGRQCPPADVPGVPITTKSPETPEEPWKNLRLPKYIVPVHYDVSLFPDFYGDNETFYGNVSVEIRVSQATPYLIIHYKQMNITKTVVRGIDGQKQLKIRRTFSHLPNEFWIVEMEHAIQAGNTVFLDLTFDGSLTNGIVGLYKSTYINSITGEKRGLATSKFEPVDARKAFPCFDEPNIKAEFTVRLRRKQNYTALSNMPVESNRARDDGLVETKFQRSVPMSTYLVCFIVCDFDFKEATTKNGKKFRVYATPDKIDQVDYALSVGKYVHDLYETYFDMEYPLPKQDMVAIPDFVSGAMEHWGLITYRETNLLYNETEASASNKQRVAVVIAHELAHQWFGNIVTMDWWDDLWLNEGFASFMEYKGIDNFHKEWNMVDQFVTEDLQPVFGYDSVVSSHPIVVSVTNPSEITEVFDAISYSKGAAVIRMLEAFMGRDNFKEGIRRYLKAFEYDNAKTEHLWSELQKVQEDGIPKIGDIMDTWTRQMGFPVVTIQYEGNVIKAKQQRYLSDPKAITTDDSPYGYKWYVPLHYTTSESNVSHTEWMKKEDIQFVSPFSLTENRWIKFNVNATGFYRVNYPPEQWNVFAEVLFNRTDVLWPADRSSLMDDAFNLARSGQLNYSVPLGLTKYLKNELNYLPWESANMGLNYVDDMLENTTAYAKWKNFMKEIAKPIVEELGWENNGTHLDKYLRSLVIHKACAHGARDCLDKAKQLFQKWMNGEVILHPNLRSVVYRYGMQEVGNATAWNFVWDRYKSETVPQEKIKLLSALGKTQHVDLLERYLEMAMNESNVRSQDFFGVVAYIRDNPIGRPLVWSWTRRNWERLVQKFGIDHRYLGRMVPGIIHVFNTQSKLDEVQEFFQKYPDAGAGERGRIQALEEIKGNIAWMKTHETTIETWLNENVS